jgi:DNA-binding transcriptional regulator GbsR (MarR family)
MTVEEGRARFVQAWGQFGSAWGINRTMAQIHALLLIAPDPLSADQIMEQLNISRGNANMNLRALIDWGLVAKQLKLGERREYFVAEKDIWQVSKRITRERKKRELNPLKEFLDEIDEVGLDSKGAEAEELQQMVGKINRFAGTADRILETIMKADETWFFKIFSKLIR